MQVVSNRFKHSHFLTKTGWTADRLASLRDAVRASRAHTQQVVAPVARATMTNMEWKGIAVSRCVGDDDRTHAGEDARRENALVGSCVNEASSHTRLSSVSILQLPLRSTPISRHCC